LRQEVDRPRLLHRGSPLRHSRRRPAAL